MPAYFMGQLTQPLRKLARVRGHSGTCCQGGVGPCQVPWWVLRPTGPATALSVRWASQAGKVVIWRMCAKLPYRPLAYRISASCSASHRRRSVIGLVIWRTCAKLLSPHSRPIVTRGAWCNTWTCGAVPGVGAMVATSVPSSPGNHSGVATTPPTTGHDGPPASGSRHRAWT